MKMTTPVYTEMADNGPIAEGNIQVVLPLKSKLSEWVLATHSTLSFDSVQI